MNNILLMTACVNPNLDVPVLILSDRNARIKHYSIALEKYITESFFDSIVLCDNSGFDFAGFQKFNEISKKYNKKLEMLSFCGDSSKAVSKGKSYGEGEIINWALNNSELLSGQDYFFKVSGRYYLKNNRTILKSINKEFDYFAPWNFSLHRSNGIDSVFFAMKKEDYLSYVASENEKANDTEGYGYERILYDCLRDKFPVEKWKYFNVCPMYDVPFQASTGIKPSYKWYKQLIKNLILQIYRFKKTICNQKII